MDPYEIAVQLEWKNLQSKQEKCFQILHKQIIEIVRNTRASECKLLKLPENEFKERNPKLYKKFKKAQRDIDRLTSSIKRKNF